MLIQPRRGLAHADDGESLLALLLGCHGRIRRFTALAVTLAEPATADRAPAEIADGADAVRRYLEVALPLHAADEDLSLAPRLLAHAPGLADALARMHAEHLAHAPLLADVVARCAAIARAPHQLAALGPGLAEPARALAAALLAHVDEEERTVFPAATALPYADQTAIVAELRARRLG